MSPETSQYDAQLTESKRVIERSIHPLRDTIARMPLLSAWPNMSDSSAELLSQYHSGKESIGSACKTHCQPILEGLDKLSTGEATMFEVSSIVERVRPEKMELAERALQLAKDGLRIAEAAKVELRPYVSECKTELESEIAVSEQFLRDNGFPGAQPIGPLSLKKIAPTRTQCVEARRKHTLASSELAEATNRITGFRNAVAELQNVLATIAAKAFIA